jgi:fluoroquinolone transport system ATP-binding protein
MLEVRNLRFAYHQGTTPVLYGLDFAIAAGEIFGFLGPSGSGKSTTQKILIKLLKEFEGEVTVLGRDLRQWHNDYYEQVGVSFELPNHYQKLSALENLQLFRSLYHIPTADPLELLALVGLEQDAHTRVGQFSKGMQMRLNFVRALLHHPKLLFLDEPTAGLDPINARKIKEIILDYKRKGTTIFLTTHDMKVADDLCDRVAFIVDGTIKLVDSPRALKLHHGRQSVQVEYRQNGHMEQHLFPLEQLGSNERFLAVIRDYPVETIHTQEATLEEIFIQVTGRGLT